MKSIGHERGAAAVEFALVAPLLIALFLGIATFGRAYQVQAILSSAAREGARVMAITEDVGAAQDIAQASAPSVNPISVDVGACVGDPIKTTTVVVSHQFSMLGETFRMSGEAVMRCGG